MTGSHIGKTFWLSAALPATNDAAGFAALTWTKVNGLQVAPQLGISHGNIDVPDLQTGFTEGLKGAATGNDSTASFRKVASDAGQALAKTAAESAAGLCSIKIGKGSGTDQALETGDPVQYAQGYLHSYVEIEGNNTTHEGFSVNFHQNGLTIDATQPAP
ncbi:hypothetical protein LCM17_18665 [Cereibacter sphaeroides]|nr:hypothetical protein [Cereibacter sphaeroides]